METIADTFRCVYKSCGSVHSRPSTAEAAAAARVSISVGRSPLSPILFIFLSDHLYYTRTAHPIPVLYFRSPDFPIFQFFLYYTCTFPLPLATRLRTADFFQLGGGSQAPGPSMRLPSSPGVPTAASSDHPSGPIALAQDLALQYTFHSHSNTEAGRTALETETHRPYPRDIPDPRAIAANQTGSHSISTSSSTTDSSAEAHQLTR